jgi:reactive intermediate/imine deaminase
MKKIVQPSKVHVPQAGYSHAVKVTGSELIFVAGQISRDKNGNIVGVDDIEAQTKQVLENLRAVLEEANSGLDDVVWTEIYLTDMTNRDRMFSIYSKCFSNSPPPNVLIEVRGLARKEFLVEIAAIAAPDG